MKNMPEKWPWPWASRSLALNKRKWAMPVEDIEDPLVGGYVQHSAFEESYRLELEEARCCGYGKECHELTEGAKTAGKFFLGGLIIIGFFIVQFAFEDPHNFFEIVRFIFNR